ncbi:MAG: AAA family ATPase [Romboutsia sp.]
MININQNELNIINKTLMLGTLATGYEENITNAVEPASNEKEHIVFYVENLSTESYILEEINDRSSTEHLYRALDNFNANIYPFSSRLEYKILSKKEKIAKIYESLDGKVILFSSRVNAKGQKNMVIEEVLEYAICTNYETVPVVKLDNNEFEYKLINKKPFEMYNYSTLMPCPTYLICGDYIYTGFDKWLSDEDNYLNWIHDGSIENIKKIKFPLDMEDYREDIIKKSEDIVFLTDYYLDEKIDKAFENKSLYESISNIEYSISEQAISMEVEIEYEGKDTTQKEVTVDNNRKYKREDECEFLHNLKQYSVKNNLCYKKEDLINFHISVKTNPLTIVAGMSGTGKTQLARAYASVLGLKEDENLLFLPIRPSYTEPEDILGYFNISSQKYIPAETGLIDFLIHAQEHSNDMHMVVFDEMNLSQIEYWFSPFMSLLELKPQDRKLKLYSKAIDCQNKDKYRSSVSIGDNILFVGTVNLDETTKEFSDRLLDRANIVNLNKQSFLEFNNEKKLSQNNTYKETIYSAGTYKNWVNETNSLEAFDDNELGLLDNLHELIQKYDKQKGVSFRILEKIGEYLHNIPKDELGLNMISKANAFDIEIKQRFLTKIKGTERQFKSLIGSFDDDTLEISNSALYDFFNTKEAKAISEFEITKEEIKRKAKELTLYGYTN